MVLKVERDPYIVLGVKTVSAWNRLADEHKLTTKHREAVEYYFGLGRPKRLDAEVAVLWGCKPVSVAAKRCNALRILGTRPAVYNREGELVRGHPSVNSKKG